MGIRLHVYPVRSSSRHSFGPSLKTEPIPLLARPFRWGIAFVWLMTGLLVLHPSYRAIGEAQLAGLGLPAWLMWATCALEVGLGIRVARGPSTGWVTVLQLGMIGCFTVLLAVQDPTLLVDPFGVLSKNLPLLALIGVVFWIERDGWTPRAEWLLRGGMAVIWITEGLFPKILFQQQLELDIVVNTGLIPVDPSAFLTVMGVCQLMSGVGVLLARGRLLSLLLAAQIAALVVLPLLVSWQDPSLWVHPFGPMTKNVPILVGTVGVFLLYTPFLSSHWSYLVLVTYAVPREVLEPRLPPGVELDERDGEVFLSFVTLDLSDVHVLGVPWPGFRSFPDVNLRFYARQGLEKRRGVVFVRELVPLKFVAWVARTLFHEPFDYAPITSSVTTRGDQVIVERTFERGGRSHSIRVTAGASGETPDASSRAHFFKERYWGFGASPFGEAIVFRVEHPPWELLPIELHTLDVDFEAVYDAEWAFLNDLQPVSVDLAKGSRARVWFPR
jgi:uncharacterized protein YqjF (DUF2071 family)